MGVRVGVRQWKQGLRVLLSAALIVLGSAAAAEARGKLQGYVERGGVRAITPGSGQSKTFQQSFPNATVHIYIAGTLTLATLYSDEAGTPKANPFTAGTDASWSAYVDGGCYDVRFSGSSGGVAIVPWTEGNRCVTDSGASSVEFLNVMDYGAKADMVTRTGAIDAAATTLTITTSSFTTADVGKYVSIPGAGAAGVTHKTTIAAYIGPTQVTLTNAAITTVAAAACRIATDDRPAFLAAFIAAGDRGREVWAPRNAYYFATPLILNTTTLGFNWRGIRFEGELSGRPGAFADITRIYTDDTTAIRIEIVNNYPWAQDIQIKNLTFRNLQQEVKTGTAAIHLWTDLAGVEGTYKSGRFFDSLSIEGYGAGIWFQAVNPSTLNSRYVGMTAIDRFHTYNTDDAVFVDGHVMNIFSGRDWLIHIGRFHVANVGAVLARLSNIYFQSSPTAAFVLDSSVASEFVLQDWISESNDELIAGTSTSGQKFTFLGSCRVPGGAGELPPRVPAVELSAYTDRPLRITPQGTLIRTPETVDIVAPTPTAADYTSTNRVFWFAVPYSVALNKAPVRYTPMPLAGQRSGNTNAVGAIRSAGYPYLKVVSSSANPVVWVSDVAIPNPDSKTVFTIATSLGITPGSTRLTPIAYTITDGGGPHASTHTMAHVPWATGEYAVAWGLALLSGESITALSITATNPLAGYNIAPAYGSWQEKERAINHLIPAGHVMEWKETIADASSGVLRLYQSQAAGSLTGNLVRVTITVGSDGRLGHGQWVFAGINAGTKSQTAVVSAPQAGITFTPAAGVNVDIGILTIANTTGAPVTVRAVIEYL